MYYYPKNTDNVVEEVPFEEVKIALGRIVAIQSCKEYIGFYAKITHIPTSLLIHKDNNELAKMSSSLSNISNLSMEKTKSTVSNLDLSKIDQDVFCKENHLNELYGIVEVSIIIAPDETVFDAPVKKHYCVCHLQNLDSKLEMKLEKLMMEKEEGLMVSNFEEVYNVLLDYNVYLETPELVGTLSEEVAKEMLDKLENDAKNAITLGINVSGKLNGFSEV